MCRFTLILIPIVLKRQGLSLGSRLRQISGAVRVTSCTRLRLGGVMYIMLSPGAAHPCHDFVLVYALLPMRASCARPPWMRARVRFGITVGSWRERGMPTGEVTTIGA